jgi:mRNA-degrading endonuclease RelE of RelBE toxin-antitoxin system
MDNLAKALQKLSLKEQKLIQDILLRIKNNSWSGLDLKKLKNCEDIFRIRKGRLRVIFKKKGDGRYFILTVERRSDKTYSNY